MDLSINVRLTAYEAQLLLEIEELPDRVREQARAAATAGQAAEIELSHDEAIETGKAIVFSFAFVGFGDAPATFADGYRVDDLIDKFLAN